MRNGSSAPDEIMFVYADVLRIEMETIEFTAQTLFTIHFLVVQTVHFSREIEPTRREDKSQTIISGKNRFIRGKVYPTLYLILPSTSCSLHDLPLPASRCDWMLSGSPSLTSSKPFSHPSSALSSCQDL